MIRPHHLLGPHPPGEGPMTPEEALAQAMAEEAGLRAYTVRYQQRAAVVLAALRGMAHTVAPVADVRGQGW